MIRIKLLMLLALASLIGPFALGQDDRPPNLVIIIADDLGYGDLGCYGSVEHSTPNIDRLAAQGARFSNFYMTSSVCTPARVALLTGRHPVRVGFSTLLWPTTEGGLPAEENTLPELLAERGYVSGLAGKWHLGHSAPEHLPLAHGFDTFYGMPYPNDMGPGHPVEEHFGGNWPPMPMMQGNEIVEAPIDVNLLTQQYTAEALRFIAAHHNEPFFLFLSHAMPHSIVGASPDFRGSSANGLYGDAVQEIDWSTGEVMRVLRAFGLEDNTLVVFSSDNGAVLPSMHDNRPEIASQMFPDLTFGSNGPLRGGKVSTFEGGVRVPGIFRWPGVIPAGQAIDQPAWIADLLPTFLDFAGIALPDDREYDGETLRSLLTGTGHRKGDEFVFGRNGLTALRQGDWKLVLPERQPNFLQVDDGPMLFNIREDISETANLAEQHPERLARMLERLEVLTAEALADPISR